MSELIDGLLNGERRALAKAITLIESSSSEHQEAAHSLMQQVLPHSGQSIRIGITGVPGVGKSTFIESLGMHLVSQGLKVAVLAVDPSSPLKGGSVLGDKTRMEKLSRSDQSYIRPSPSSSTLGGVARSTRESMMLCEAAGFEVILVETVGVGQSEYVVASMTDLFLVLMLPNAGDELQGIKRGIMELADLLIINKSDGEMVSASKQTQSQYQSALALMHSDAPWDRKVLTCSALHQRDIDVVWETIKTNHNHALQDGYVTQKRIIQNSKWFDQVLQSSLIDMLNQNSELSQMIEQEKELVTTGKETPYASAKRIISSWINRQPN